jgi:hypothetical protein
MEWMEQIKAAWNWLPKDPGTVLDGWGTNAVSGLLSLAGAAALWFISRFHKPNAASIQHDASDWLAKNRRKLLGRFQRELVDRRRSFLLGHTALELDKKLDPKQVSRPYSFLYMTDCTWEQDGVPVETTDQPIVDLFCRPDVGEQLAILGKPGSGKTVCLLTLLEHLLQTAQDNDAAPLPVVFECSEWDGRELSLWMAAQLHRKYQFPEDMARHLVQAHDILPLFDGLDELATEKQGSFVSQFNLFADNRPLAICCRLEEYHQLQERSRQRRESTEQKLALRNAAILQDITPQRLKGHLLRTGLEDIWTVLEQSRIEAGQPQSLLELAQRPLFLGLLIEVAQDLRQGFGRQPGKTWEDFLWRNYLKKQLNMPPSARGKNYSQQQSLHWLRCLAKWMQAEQKVKLWIDELQPTMLKNYWRFGLLYTLCCGLFYGLPVGLFTGMIHGVAMGLIAVVSYALPLWLFYMNIGKIEIAPLRPLRLPVSWQDWKSFSVMLDHWLGQGLAVGLPLGLMFEGIGLMFETILAGKIGLQGLPSTYVIAFVLPISSVIGLAAGLKAVAGPISETDRPHERLKEALCSTLLLFPLVMLAGMTVFVQVLFWAESTGIAVIFFNMQLFYFALLIITFCIFLTLGTNTVLQHYLLRLCLRWEGQLPLRLVSWLEAMQQRKVLQQVGGSYHFLHKQLQEYLAKQIGVAGMLRRTGKTVSLEEMEEAIRKGAQERK